MILTILTAFCKFKRFFYRIELNSTMKGGYSICSQIKKQALN